MALVEETRRRAYNYNLGAVEVFFLEKPQRFQSIRGQHLDESKVRVSVPGKISKYWATYLQY